MDDPSRREVLGVTAAGTALSLAGCSALDDGDTDGTTPDTNGAEGAVTVAVDIEARMAEREAEIQQQLEDEEISQEEAQAEFETAQIEALEAAVAAVESYAADVDGLNVVDSNSQAGALLVDGDPAEIIETLDNDDVAGLVAAAQFEQLQQQPTEGE